MTKQFDIAAEIAAATQMLQAFESDLANPQRTQAVIDEKYAQIAKLEADITQLEQMRANLPDLIAKQRQRIAYLHKRYHYEKTTGNKLRELEKLQQQAKLLQAEIRNDQISARRKGETQ